MIRKIAVKLALFGCFSLLVLYFMPNNIILAKSDETPRRQLEEETEAQLDNLDTEALENFFDTLSDEEKERLSANGAKELVRSVLSGEFDDGLGSVAGVVFKSFFESVTAFLPSLVAIVAVVIVYGVLSGLNSGFLTKPTNDVVFFVCYAIVITALLGTVGNYVDLTANTVGRLKTLMNALFPLFLTLIAASGGTASAGLYQPLMAVATGFTVNVISGAVIPCFVAAVVFTVVGNLSKNVSLNKFASFFKTGAEWLLGIVFSLFMTFVTTRSVAGVTIDGAGVAAAKFAIGSYVPVLGGYLSDGFDLVLASCILLKNSVGAAGLAIMLCVILSPIVRLSAFSLSLKLASAIVEPVSDKKFSDLLGGVSKCLNILLATLFGTGFMYFILILLVIYTCNFGAV